LLGFDALTLVVGEVVMCKHFLFW
jgi:hypothetical protein